MTSASIEDRRSHRCSKVWERQVSQIITLERLQEGRRVMGRGAQCELCEADSIMKAIPAELGMTIAKAR